MRLRLLAALILAAAGLAGCQPYPGPAASCFALTALSGPCEFLPVPGAEGVGDGDR